LRQYRLIDAWHPPLLNEDTEHQRGDALLDRAQIVFGDGIEGDDADRPP
jgi:hypothetical protein